MKRLSILSVLLAVQIVFLSAAHSGDFDWMDSLNIKAEADSSGYRIELATRFRLGNTEIQAVIGNVDRPSDAYMLLLIGELTHRSLVEVFNVYHNHKKQGWGAMAKQLGIKPGSSAFHALKRGHDLYGEKGHGQNEHAMKGNGNGKNKHKGNNKYKGKK